jgi:phage virion morphogenesis protein
MAAPTLVGQGRRTAFLKKKLRQMGINTRKVFGQKELETRMLKRTQKRFLNEVDPDGKPWKPLDPSTRKKYGTAGPDQILIDSGNMARDIQIIRGRTAKGPGTVRVNTGAGFSIGTPNTKYAALHQLGSEDVPARPFLGITNEDIRSLTRMVTNMLNGKKVRP